MAAPQRRPTRARHRRRAARAARRWRRRTSRPRAARHAHASASDRDSGGAPSRAPELRRAAHLGGVGFAGGACARCVVSEAAPRKSRSGMGRAPAASLRALPRPRAERIEAAARIATAPPSESAISLEEGQRGDGRGAPARGGICAHTAACSEREHAYGGAGVRGAGEVTGVWRKRVRYNGRGPKA